jgi:hypothetical protein
MVLENTDVTPKIPSKHCQHEKEHKQWPRRSGNTNPIEALLLEFSLASRSFLVSVSSLSTLSDSCRALDPSSASAVFLFFLSAQYKQSI